MDEGELRRAVQELIAQTLKDKKVEISPDAVKEGVSLSRELGIDSLDALQLSALVEKRYKLQFSEEEIRGMDDLGSIMRAVRKHLPPAK